MVSVASRHRVSNPAHYTRNSIVGMSQEEFRKLNIDEFILANIGRYTKVSILATKHVFRSFEADEIANDIYVEAKPQLDRVHRNNLNAKGERRAELLFMALKYCACRHVPSLLAERYGLKIEVRADDKRRRSKQDDLGDDLQDDPEPVCSAAENDTREDTSNSDLEERAQEEQRLLDRIGVWLSILKDQISDREYVILERLLLDDKCNKEIAGLLETSRHCINATRERMRRKIERSLSSETIERLRVRYQQELEARGMTATA